MRLLSPGRELNRGYRVGEFRAPALVGAAMGAKSSGGRCHETVGKFDRNRPFGLKYTTETKLVKDEKGASELTDLCAGCTNRSIELPRVSEHTRQLR